MTRLDIVQQVRGCDGIVGAAFSERALAGGLVHLRRASFPAGEVSMPRLTALGDVELAERTESGHAVLLREEPDMLVYISVVHGEGEIAVAGTEREAVDQVANAMVEALRDREADEESVPVVFWAYTGGVPMRPRRMLAAPRWDSIRGNYAAPARAALDALTAAAGPGDGGLVLWHGPPGTGKSYALRALAREWRGWCETHFITDPDVFLGRAGYLLQPLLRPRGDGRWRLIVLEDAGELLAADARAVAGQGLSRLLNLSDGLVGAGMRALVLLTTNEPLKRMHPAVVRPGRTWAEVEFPPLSADEANAWLAARGSELRVDRPTTLAELYAGRASATDRPLGFAA